MDVDSRAPSRVAPSPGDEWLEADGLGGFASGTVGGTRERRYHALLLAAATPPTGRVVLVNGLEARVETPAGTFELFPQRYEPGVLHPPSTARLLEFTCEPWPRWTLELADGTRLVHELVVPRGLPLVILSWELSEPRPGLRLRLRPFLSGRDQHGLLREERGFDFAAERAGERVTWAPAPGLPRVAAVATGPFRDEPLWYRSFLYREERERGYDAVEDLAAPGVFELDLERGEGFLVLAAQGPGLPAVALPRDAADVRRWARARRVRELERRAELADPLERSAEAYLVARGSGSTIVAGYPWFTDWGRDTFLSLRGLCLATGRLEEAGAILDEWSGHVRQGLLPNRFVDVGEEPEYHSVDAPLWYAVAVGEYLRLAPRVPAARRRRLEEAVLAIVGALAAGTRYGIRADADGLLACGVPGYQLTWMDARIGERVVTPRIGKPVEVQALWLHALEVAERLDGALGDLRDRAAASFEERFTDPATGGLVDVVDADHVPGAVDASVRPNQILAVGGLPRCLLSAERARAVVELVERRLLTPLGLRTLDPGDPRYVGRYAGGTVERDEAYHQGTAWPWLLGPFVEAWVRVRGASEAARREARRRFLAPLREHLGTAGLGHVSEVVDGDAPHRPGGAPFQAWSLAELLRLERDVLAERPTGRRARHARTGRGG